MSSEKGQVHRASTRKIWKSSRLKNPRSGQGKSINMELCNGKRVTITTATWVVIITIVIELVLRMLL